jgi:hypothetical protein
MIAAERYVSTAATTKALNEALVLVERNLPCFPCHGDHRQKTQRNLSRHRRRHVSRASTARPARRRLAGNRNHGVAGAAHCRAWQTRRSAGECDQVTMT